MTSRTYRENYGLIDWSKDLGPIEPRQHNIRRNRNVISDTLPDQLEHMGYSDGRRTDSKSRFRQWTREAGLVEKGNDREGPRPVKAPDLRGDVAQAINMLRNGYRPNIQRE